ncbi:Uncharacterized protein DAT39_018897, partial [Clarias magur]
FTVSFGIWSICMCLCAGDKHLLTYTQTNSRCAVLFTATGTNAASLGCVQE